MGGIRTMHTHTYVYAWYTYAHCIYTCLKYLSKYNLQKVKSLTLIQIYNDRSVLLDGLCFSCSLDSLGPGPGLEERAGFAREGT